MTTSLQATDNGAFSDLPKYDSQFTQNGVTSLQATEYVGYSLSHFPFVKV